jgi:hypothetical protein
MLEVIKPRIIVIYGAEPIDHFERYCGRSLKRGAFTRVKCLGSVVDILPSVKHFSRVSRAYVMALARRINERLASDRKRDVTKSRRRGRI